MQKIKTVPYYTMMVLYFISGIGNSCVEQYWVALIWILPLIQLFLIFKQDQALKLQEEIIEETIEELNNEAKFMLKTIIDGRYNAKRR